MRVEIVPGLNVRGQDCHKRTMNRARLGGTLVLSALVSACSPDTSDLFGQSGAGGTGVAATSAQANGPSSTGAQGSTVGSSTHAAGSTVATTSTVDGVTVASSSASGPPVCAGTQTGEVCNGDFDCSTNNCIGQKCYAREIGNPCDDDFDCATNNCFALCCTSNELGSQCDDDFDCTSNNCFGGFCTSNTPGSPCDDDFDCASTHCKTNGHCQ